MNSKFILDHFGVDVDTYLEALKMSPSAQGYILGSISEILLKRYLEKREYEVVRIKEKPSGGYNAKNYEARGDFYIRKKNKWGNDEWLVVESKGLKSNSEFRGSKLDSPKKVYNFLKSKIFDHNRSNERIYKKSYSTYLKIKRKWERANPGNVFPEFKCNKEFPGPETFYLKGLWNSEKDLIEWINSFSEYYFTEEAYRKIDGIITILETHQPSKRKGIVTGIEQAAPLVYDFNIMCVDLFLRTRKHEFVFMNSEEISHSPTSPEHLYQNYTIDILVKDLKPIPVIQRPWYRNIEDCIKITKPSFRSMDESQVDNR